MEISKKKIIKDYAPKEELKNKLNTANKNYFNACVKKYVMALTENKHTNY